MPRPKPSKRAIRTHADADTELADRVLRAAQLAVDEALELNALLDKFYARRRRIEAASKDPLRAANTGAKKARKPSARKSAAKRSAPRTSQGRRSDA